MGAPRRTNLEGNLRAALTFAANALARSVPFLDPFERLE
jgi:hypothetical protein